MILFSLGIGLLLAVVYTMAPLAVWTILIAAAVFAWARRGLPPNEQRVLAALLAAAAAARLLFVLVAFLRNIPYHHDLWPGDVAGDGGYSMARALRARDLVLGVPISKYDAFIVNDIYGSNWYIGLVTVLQVLFGPAPYSVRLLNGVLFLAGALCLFRCTRSVYGRLPAFAALTLVVFLPSFFVWSVSLLKEPLYFFCTAVFLGAAAGALRAGPLVSRVASGAVGGVALAAMEGVRHKTLGIGLLGLSMAIGLYVVSRNPRRYLPAGIALAAAAVLALASSPVLQARLIGDLTEAAKIHAGHVFTPGHGYKLLDDGFYYRVQDPNSSTLTLTADETARYVVRAAASFVMTPLPWQAASVEELAYTPEQLVWYCLVALLPLGIVAAWRRDPALAAVLIGYVVSTGGVLALTNGNVGTLVRLRGMVMIVVVWLSAVGGCEAMRQALARRERVGAIGPAIRPEIAR